MIVPHFMLFHLMILWIWYSDLISHTHIHTNIHNTLRPINWHTYIKMNLHHPPCVHSSCLYHTLNNSLISKVYFPMSFLFKNYSLVEVVYFHIRCNKTKFFLWNTNNTDKNDANKKNTHTKHLEKDNTGKEGGRGGSNNEPGCFWIFVFDIAKEASNEVTTFLNLRFITKQKPASFWENITC